MALEKPTKIGLGSGATVLFGIIFGWAAFPKILNFALSKQLTLARGTDIRDMWTIIPFPLEFKVYVFNYTNYMDVQRGERPIIQEIGPYYYDEWKEKVNLVDLEDEDAIVYNRRDTFIFNKKKSGPGLTGNELIYTPHIIIVSTVVTVNNEKPSMLSLVGKAINGIYDNPATIFAKTTPAKLLFDGINIDCDKTDFAPKAVCSVMMKLEAFDVLPGNQLKFSLFGRKNGTIEESKFKVLRGIRNIMDVGKVVEFGDQKTQSVWNGPNCNDYVGTDGTVFPPFLTENDELSSFTPEICRSVSAWYKNKTSYSGLATNRYVADLGDLPNQPELHCFCESPDTCPKKGLMNITRCIQAPFFISMPHYLEADPTVQESVQGFKPDVEKHGINIDFEPITGTPLQARKRIQFNLFTPKIEKLDLFRNFSDSLLPLFWIEEGLALNKTFIGMLEKQLFILLRVVNVSKWLMIVSGSIGVLGSVIYKYKSKIINYSVGPAPTQVNGINLQKNLRISTLQNLQNQDKSRY